MTQRRGAPAPIAAPPIRWPGQGAPVQAKLGGATPPPPTRYPGAPTIPTQAMRPGGTGPAPALQRKPPQTMAPVPMPKSPAGSVRTVQARAPVSAAAPARSRLPGPPARAGVLQRAVILDVQQGPSCWLAVGTALVGARNHNRATLDALISLYPRDSSGEGRAEIMGMIVDALDNAIARLNTYRLRGNLRITTEQVREFVRRGFLSVGQSVNADQFFARYFQGADHTVMAAVGVLATARDHAESFRDEMEQQGEATTAIYGYAGIEFGADNDIGTLNDLLGASMGHASASLSVTGRYLPAPGQALNGLGQYDLKARPLHQGGAHVLVLTNVSPATDTITYRDPNFGNVDMLISFAQFEAMRVANSGSIRLNSVNANSPLVRVATGGRAIPTL